MFLCLDPEWDALLLVTSVRLLQIYCSCTPVDASGCFFFFLQMMDKNTPPEDDILESDRQCILFITVKSLPSSILTRPL